MSSRERGTAPGPRRRPGDDDGGAPRPGPQWRLGAVTVGLRPGRHRVVLGERHRPAAERLGPVAGVTTSFDGVVVDQGASARWPRPSLLPRRPA
jgi:hypothetical protein